MDVAVKQSGMTVPLGVPAVVCLWCHAALNLDVVFVVVTTSQFHVWEMP